MLVLLYSWKVSKLTIFYFLTLFILIKTNFYIYLLNLKFIYYFYWFIAL